jgi:hypothetical protein
MANLAHAIISRPQWFFGNEDTRTPASVRHLDFGSKQLKREVDLALENREQPLGSGGRGDSLRDYSGRTQRSLFPPPAFANKEMEVDHAFRYDVRLRRSLLDL